VNEQFYNSVIINLKSINDKSEIKNWFKVRFNFNSLFEFSRREITCFYILHLWLHIPLWQNSNLS